MRGNPFKAVVPFTPKFVDIGYESIVSETGDTVAVFWNQAQSFTATCGAVSLTVTIPALTVYSATSLGAANALALGMAEEQAEAQIVCP
jgi:hypothetical protein